MEANLTMQIIGLTGPARSGKSTVAGMLNQHGYEVYGFADALKSAVKAMLIPLGIAVLEHLDDEARKEIEIDGLGVSPRYLWQTLGTEWGRERIRSDFWIRILAAQIERDRRSNFIPHIVVADVRFANEARWIIEQGGEVWRIVRPGYESTARSHSSEAGVPAAFLGQGVVNDGDMEALAERVQLLLGLRAE